LDIRASFSAALERFVARATGSGVGARNERIVPNLASTWGELALWFNPVGLFMMDRQLHCCRNLNNNSVGIKNAPGVLQNCRQFDQLTQGQEYKQHFGSRKIGMTKTVTSRGSFCKQGVKNPVPASSAINELAFRKTHENRAMKARAIWFEAYSTWKLF